MGKSKEIAGIVKTLPPHLIEDFENNNIWVTDEIDGKVYNIEEVPKIRDCACAVRDLLEKAVYHVIRTHTSKGDSLFFLTEDEEKYSCYAYYPESPQYSDEAIVLIEIKNDKIIFKGVQE